jgi:hypothetical protein
VDTETVTVNGDGTYTTPTGFTLPSSGAVSGTYQWNATYSGDSNNNAASDVNSTDEQVTVSAASGQNSGANGGSDSGQNGGANGGQNGGSAVGQNSGASSGAGSGSTVGQNGGANGGQNGGSDSGASSGQSGGASSGAGSGTGGANGGSDSGSAASTGPTSPTSPSEPMVPVAPQLPPLASRIDSPAVGGVTGQPNAARGDQLPSLPGAPPARDLAFLPQQGKAPSASGGNSLVVGALMAQVNAVGTARFSNLSGTVQVRDLAFLPQDFVLAGARLTPATSGHSDQNVLVVHDSTDPVELAAVQGVVYGDRDANGEWSEGEPHLVGRSVRLVDGAGQVVAETRTDHKGEYLFLDVSPGQYRVEVEEDAEFSGAGSPAFGVAAGVVKVVDPLGLPPAEDAAEEGAWPEDGDSPSVDASNAYWALLGAALPIFHSWKGRRPAAAATRQRAH